jgi:hypothetical protein
MSEEASSLVGRNPIEGFAEGVPEVFDRSQASAPELVLHLREGEFDRIQIRTVRRQIQHARVTLGERFGNATDLVRLQIVQNEDVARPQARSSS